MNRNNVVIGLVVGTIAASASLAGCSGKLPAGSAGSVFTSPTTYRYTAPTTTTYAPPPIQKDDFTISLKTTSKHCFGSAGCNVMVQPAIGYKYSADQLSTYGTCDITYSVSGDESGEVVATAYGTGGLQFRISSSSLSTKSSKDQVSATVTDVSCRSTTS